MNKVETFEEQQARELEAFKASQQRQAEEHKRREEIRKEEQKKFDEFKSKKIQELQDSYHAHDINEKIAQLIFDKAWEEGHAYGFHEVETYISIYEDFVEDILEAINN